MKYSYVTCDNCWKSFQLAPGVVKSEELKPGVEFQYFVCPRCRRVYVTLIQDDQMRADMQTLAAFRKASAKREGDRELSNVIRMLRERINRRARTLQALYNREIIKRVAR